MLYNMVNNLGLIHFDARSESELDITKAESIQISIGPGIPENEYDKAIGVAIEKIYLK